MNKNTESSFSNGEKNILEMLVLGQEKLEKLLDNTKGIDPNRNRNIKVFKTANDYSIMDITASLNFHKPNTKNEEVYKGKIILSITDRKKSNYLKFFIDKAKAKVLMKSIIDHTFNEKVYSGGFSDFGGTGNRDPQKIKARTLRIDLTERRQYKFSIYEGKGKVDKEKGKYTMIGEALKTVERYVPYEEALEMAHEVYDYIRDQEMKALINGKPLYTISEFETTSGLSDEGKHFFLGENQVIQMSSLESVQVGSLSHHELKHILEKTEGSMEKSILELRSRLIAEVKVRLRK